MKTVKGIDDRQRLSIIQEHLDGSSKYSLVKKYGVSSRRITGWMRTFGVENKSKDFFSIQQTNLMKTESEELLQLRKELKQLRKDLYAARMGEDVWRTMVEIAEQQLHIDIRKKYDTK